ncbi:DUF2813 domain-containing protein [Paenibacillus woosongensis]|uniref:DUF2813 domain-containing protein n=1 Tax=Paenibacillus woosongensis TaxID=307580 RepID=UPI001BCF96AC
MKKLVIQTSPFYIEDFFVSSEVEGSERLSSRITNITAIIGENGTGKSSLLEYLIHFLISFREKSAHRLIIFVVSLIDMSYTIPLISNLILSITRI